jgi:hypothetical protein
MHADPRCDNSTPHSTAYLRCCTLQKGLTHYECCFLLVRCVHGHSDEPCSREADEHGSDCNGLAERIILQGPHAVVGVLCISCFGSRPSPQCLIMV